MRGIKGTITEYPPVASEQELKDAKRASRDRHFGLAVTKIIDERTLTTAIDQARAAWLKDDVSDAASARREHLRGQ